MSMHRGTIVAGMLFGAIALLPALVIAGCGGQAPTLEELGVELGGIYRVESHTRNDASCSQEGMSVLDPQAGAYLALVQTAAMNQPIIQATACSDPDDCRQKVEQAGASQAYWAQFEFNFTEVGSGGTLTGGEVSSGSASSSESDPCHGTVSEHTLESTEAGLRIEQRSTVVDEFPKSGRMCTTEAAQAAARDLQCSRLEVITAVREAGLTR